MYNIKVYTKNDNELFILFDMIHRKGTLFSVEEILIIIKSILWSYWYWVIENKNSLSLSDMINAWFNNWDVILKEYYNINNKNLFDVIDDMFEIQINPIELPNTVEEMFK